MTTTNHLPATRSRMRSLIDELDRVLPKAFGQDLAPLVSDDDLLEATWLPAVDVKEDDDGYTITADVPGVDPKQVKVLLDDEMLSISGERKSELKTERDGYRRVERSEGGFLRRFLLPDAAQPEKVTAKCVQGVLTVRIPKAAERKARQIPIAS